MAAQMAIQTADHPSPLHFACRHGDMVTVETLLAEGVEVDMRNQHGLTPMRMWSPAVEPRAVSTCVRA